MKTTHALTGWLWIAAATALGVCTEPSPQTQGIAVADPETPHAPPDPIVAENEENTQNGDLSAFQRFKAYLWSGDSAKAIAVMKTDPRRINIPGEDRFTPLHYAAQVGNVETVRWLVSNGADINAIAVNSFTPLHLAENPAVVSLILEKKPNLTLQSNGRTPLQEAAEKLVNPGRADQREAWLKIIKMMLDAGAAYDIITAIHLNDLDRVQAILKTSPEIANHFGRNSPLRTAAELGHLDICRYLIGKYHVDVNDFEGGVGYPIIKSALAYPDIVKLLIENGADLKTRITWRGGRSGVWIVGDNATLLHHAACDGVPATIKLLIDNGVDIFAVADPISDEDDKQNALEVAAYFGTADNARAILEHPKFAQVERQNRQALLDKCLLIGAFPSQFAREPKRPQLIKLLLDKGANPCATKGALNAMLIAVREIHPDDAQQNQEAKEIVASLTEHGAKLDLFSAVAIGDEAAVVRIVKQNPELVNARHPDGYPALHFAVGMNYKSIVEALLNAGGETDIRNKCDGTGYVDETALHCAAFWGRYDIAKVLIDAGADVQALDKDGRTPLDRCRELHRKNPAEMEKLLSAAPKKQ